MSGDNLKQEAANPETVQLLGHTFRRFTKMDWMAFADASEPAYIWSGEDDGSPILIWCPTDRRLDEIPVDTAADDKEMRFWSLGEHEPLP